MKEKSEAVSDGGKEMHYEIYIDVVFFTNLLIDYILIRFTGILFRCGRSRKRIRESGEAKSTITAYHR